MLKNANWFNTGHVSQDFCLFKFPNDLPEDVDGDAEEDDEDEADDDESEHPVAQDSPICTKKIRFIKGTVSRDFLLLVFFLNQFPPSL